jgi:hypothetical protein
MCQEPEYDLPDAFISTMSKLETSGKTGKLTVKLSPDTEALVQKIAEQAGFSVQTVASALLSEGILAFRSKGVLF